LRRLVGQGGQATVEFALVLPLVVTMVLAVGQMALVVRDRMGLVNAVSAAGRAAMVEPSVDSALRAATAAGDLRDLEVLLVGDTVPGSLLTVTAKARPTFLPVVGWALRDVELTEDLVVRVE
jgi:hypothetical protein